MDIDISIPHHECKFCGQVIVETADNASPPEMFCNCIKAKQWREWFQRQQAAEDKIMLLFYGDGEKTIYGRPALPHDFIEVLQLVAQKIIDGRCKTASLKYDDRCSCSMKMGADDRLNIVRKDTWKQTEKE